MLTFLKRHSSVGLFAIVILAAASFAQGQVSPFMSLGNAQFFDNNGKPLTSGVLYSYAAGTTTQQATYVDYTGTNLNPNPIPFGSGARVAIWLTSSATYKFVLCVQNDGAACAPSDVLFSIDHVPACVGCSTGASTFTGTFISGSTTPATTGILELATADSICWRNQAGTTNLCITKDTNDVLSWTGGTIKLPEQNCTLTAIGFDYLCPSNATHRLYEAGNGNAYHQIVQSDVDINTADQVVQLHFGSVATPLALSIATGQYLRWNGSQIVGSSPNCSSSVQTSAYTLLATDCIIQASAVGGAFTITIPHAVTGVQWTITRTDSSSNALTLAPDAGQVNNLGSIFIPVGSSFVCHADGTNAWCFGGTGFDQFASTSGCTASGSPCTVTTTWASAWPDTSYFVNCTPTAEAASSSASFWVNGKTTTQFTINVDNRGMANPGGFGSFDCRGHHN